MGLELPFKVPKGEFLWTRYTKNDKINHIITTKTYFNREYYYLYRVNGKTLEKLGRAKTPVELEKLIK